MLHKSELECLEVSRTYPSALGSVGGVVGVSASFPSGQVTSIVGPSGSGKSTLLRVLAGLDRPTAGSVFVGSEDLAIMTKRQLRRLRRQSISYIFQNPAANFVDYMTALEHVQFAATLRGADADPFGLLAAFAVEHRRHHYPHQMSSGEQQRVAFAAAIAGNPLVLLADEPTAELDDASSELLLACFAELRESGSSVVIASHDTHVVDVSDRVLELRQGRMVIS